MITLAIFVFQRKPAFEDFVHSKAFFQQMAGQGVIGTGGKPNAKFADNARVKLPFLKVSAGICALLSLQGIIEKPACGGMGLKEPVLQAFHSNSGSSLFRLRQKDMRTVGKLFEGFRKGTVLHLHKEGKDITARAAAKTVKKLLFAVDGKRRGLFIMKRA